MWVPLRPDFLGAWKFGLSVLIDIKLYKEKFWQKIQAKWEYGLTTVWLKQDPPVSVSVTVSSIICLSQSICVYLYIYPSIYLLLSIYPSKVIT